MFSCTGAEAAPLFAMNIIHDCIAILIPTNTANYTKACLEAFFHQTTPAECRKTLSDIQS